MLCPGQKVQAQVFKKRGSGVEARLQEVIERSPLEREAGMCSHYALCRRLHLSDHAA